MLGPQLMAAFLLLAPITGRAADLRQCGAELLSETGHEDRSQTVLIVVDALSQKNPLLVNAVLILGIIETGLNPTPAHGKAGEIGTFQVMPTNVQWLSKQCGIHGSPENVAVSAQLAYCLLEDLMRQSDGDLDAAVAAYNAGPKAIELVRNYQPLPKVTANYLWRFKRLRERNSCAKHSD